MNIFERAARGAYRYSSVRGKLTTEQLFDLPLLSDDDFNLNEVAIAISRDLKAITTESFVETQTPQTSHIEAKLDIVKHVIAAKQAAQVAAQNRALKADKRRKLLDALAAAEDRELGAKSRDEILAELESLDEEAA